MILYITYISKCELLLGFIVYLQKVDPMIIPSGQVPYITLVIVEYDTFTAFLLLGIPVLYPITATFRCYSIELVLVEEPGMFIEKLNSVIELVLTWFLEQTLHEVTKVLLSGELRIMPLFVW